MATCSICGRTPLKGNLKSHSNRKTIRRQNLNLQTRRLNGKRVAVCTSCLRNLTKVPRAERAATA